MERQQDSENRDIKWHAISVDQLRSIDITEQVMDRVRGSVNGKLKKITVRPVKRSAVVLMSTVVALCISVSAYAASEFIQIKNKAGQVVVKTSPKPEYEYHLDSAFSKYKEQAEATLKTGEAAFYYINDAQLNAKDKLNLLKQAYKNKYTSYNAFVSEMNSKDAPIVNQPQNLMKGYTFISGEVYPTFPFSYEKAHQQILDRLIQQAKTSSTDQKLFVEKIAWNEGLSTIVVYRKGNQHLSIIGTKGTGTEIPVAKDAKSEQISIDHQQVVYVRDAENESSTNSMAWFDEKKKIVYTLFDSSNSDLTKEDFITLAKRMIQSQ